jgi:hypothetical protein
MAPGNDPPIRGDILADVLPPLNLLREDLPFIQVFLKFLRLLCQLVVGAIIGEKYVPSLIVSSVFYTGMVIPFPIP